MRSTLVALGVLVGAAAIPAAVRAQDGPEEGGLGPALSEYVRGVEAIANSRPLFRPEAAGIDGTWADDDPFNPANAGPARARGRGDSIGVDVGAGTLAHGSTQVRENGNVGTRLDLRDDLGIRSFTEVRLRYTHRYDGDSRFTFSLTDVLLRGSDTPSSDVLYNASVLKGGVPIRSRPFYVVLEGRYERVLARWGSGRGSSLSFDGGLRFDDIHWYLNGIVPATSPHAEVDEDFNKQAIPVPVLGLTLRTPLSDRWGFHATVRGTRVNHWPTLRNEGGAVAWSETFLEAGVGVTWRLSKAAAMDLGYRYQIVDINETSGEDGNAVGFATHGLVLGLTLDF